MRLTPPTKGTFGIAFLAILVGIVTSVEIGLVTGFEQSSFWALAGGAVLLVFGVVFNPDLRSVGQEMSSRLLMT